jgi:hypothetical protein
VKSVTVPRPSFPSSFHRAEKPPTGIPIDVIDGLAAAGLIRVTSKGTIYTLEQGQKLHQILSEAGIEKLV